MLISKNKKRSKASISPDDEQLERQNSASVSGFTMLTLLTIEGVRINAQDKFFKTPQHYARASTRSRVSTLR